MSDVTKDTEAYLARIRKTIEASKGLVSQVQLRIAETDRMLERQGLTREQVMAMKFSEAQMEAVNAELRRRGLDPLERWEKSGWDAEREQQDEAFGAGRETPGAPHASPSEAVTDAELENRRQKFGMMMKPFQI